VKTHRDGSKKLNIFFKKRSKNFKVKLTSPNTFFLLQKLKRSETKAGKEEYCWAITQAEILEERKICCPLQCKISPSTREENLELFSFTWTDGQTQPF